ncbi:MAG: DUF2062 domain-containing protein, partial [Clostridia bacterium]|nr:DUF2062 domain-containing protein [Clostridia bacterium]
MRFSEAKEKLKKLLTLKGSPWDIALGAAIGFFWNFIPSLGVGFLLSLLMARLLG